MWPNFFELAGKKAQNYKIKQIWIKLLFNLVKYDGNF
jgi:hypothetical protein